MSGWVDISKQRADLMAAQEQYGKDILAWLHQNFQDLDAHPAAVAAVIRLHWTVGKGRLTRAEHGPVIRAAVASFDERFSGVRAS